MNDALSPCMYESGLLLDYRASFYQRAGKLLMTLILIILNMDFAFIDFRSQDIDVILL